MVNNDCWSYINANIMLKVNSLSKSNDTYFYLKDKIIIIVPNYIKYWDNFHIDRYAEYLKQKFIYNLKHINLN